MMKARFGHSRHRQQGAALIVAMIIMLIMTVAGLSAIGGSNTEMKMVNNTKARQQAFWAAESALYKVEQAIEDHGFDVNQLFNSCTGILCFNANCVGGLCFNGEYLPVDSPLDCTNEVLEIPIWKDPVLDVWGDDSKHGNMPVDGAQNDVKYVIEFLCYVIKDKSSTFDITNPTNGAPLFRITVTAESDSGAATVMLQSTYKWLNDSGVVGSLGGQIPGLPGV